MIRSQHHWKTREELPGHPLALMESHPLVGRRRESPPAPHRLRDSMLVLSRPLLRRTANAPCPILRAQAHLPPCTGLYLMYFNGFLKIFIKVVHESPKSHSAL